METSERLEGEIYISGKVSSAFLWEFKIHKTIKNRARPLFCPSDKMSLAFFSCKWGYPGPVFGSPEMSEKEIITTCIHLLTHPSLDPVMSSAFDPSPCFNIWSLDHSYNVWQYQVAGGKQNQGKTPNQTQIPWVSWDWYHCPDSHFKDEATDLETFWDCLQVIQLPNFAPGPLTPWWWQSWPMMPSALTRAAAATLPTHAIDLHLPSPLTSPSSVFQPTSLTGIHLLGPE